MMPHKVGGDRSGHFLQASVTLGSRAIIPWEAFDPISPPADDAQGRNPEFLPNCEDLHQSAIFNSQ